MNKIAAVKLVARVIVGAGATTTSNAIISNNVSMDNLNLLGKISVVSSTFVIGSMASQAAKSHTDALIDDTVKAFATLKSTDATTV